ncbi:hypothetical protein [Clostridium vincentii]|uniref:hypothetical protein n=1 Tax=Clostridium vincentii TaxID=52704 RepID=UPI001FA8EDC2|nr:hypothetical protein [Clostridium vincentii]
MKKRKVIVILVSLMVICSIATIVALKFPYDKLKSYLENTVDNLIINKVNVPDESSKIDTNENGIVDPIDIVNSARREVQQQTIYKDAYYS